MTKYRKDYDLNSILSESSSDVRLQLPVDFEKLAKLPPGNGYPHSIRSEDLMRNFCYVDILPSHKDDDIRIDFDVMPGVTGRHQQKRAVITGASGSLHSFKVTKGSGYELWNIEGGAVRSNNGSSVVVDSVSDLAASDGQSIILGVTRDSSSREVTAASISAGAPSSSTESTQYIVIAEIIGTSAKQYVLDDLNLQELLIIENGEFRLAPVSIATRNTYDPPV